MSPQTSMMTAKSKDRTEVLSDRSIDSVKDFKQAYNKLAKTLISSSSQKKTNSKARLLITDKSVGDFKRQQESKILYSRSTSGLSIHDRLYKEKEKYFENKNRDNSQKKLEEELSLCTFSPQLKGDRPKRNFDQVY